MNHFDRLMQRALALPRAAAPALFDPFDQVAPPDALEPPPLHTASASARPAARADDPAAKAQAPTPHRPLPTPVEAQRPAAVGPLDAPARAVQPPTPSAMPMPDPPFAAPQRTQATGPAPLDALARADQFMRGLGVHSAALPALSPEPPPAAPLPLRPASAAGAAEATPATARNAQPLPPQAHTAAPARPRLLEPVPPPPRTEPSPHAEARRPGAAAQVGEARTTASPPKANPAPGPVPGTTLIVQAPARRPWASELEQLGRSTPMARFGIGQW